MSGSFASTGMLTNEGKMLHLSDIQEIMNLKILDLSILSIPLKANNEVFIGRLVGKVLQSLIHPAIFSPTLTHIAIQLSLENYYVIIIEYGQYYSNLSEIRNTGIFASSSNSSNSSQRSRTDFNNLQYYYINKDGVRLTILHREYLEYIRGTNTSNMVHLRLDYNTNSYISLFIMACNHYKISYEQLVENVYNNKMLSFYDFKVIECNVKNKMSLRDLCNHFKGHLWEAKSYNLANHNCQHFAAEVIKILKAVRIHDVDKVRSREKDILPNCIISNLWDNEELSVINTFGRIPVFGLVFDSFAMDYFDKEDKSKLNY